MLHVKVRTSKTVQHKLSKTAMAVPKHAKYSEAAAASPVSSTHYAMHTPASLHTNSCVPNPPTTL